MDQVALAAIAFVGTHFLLSHPLRAPLVGAIGERGFLLLYSLVAFATLGWLVWAYRAALPGAPLWPVGDGLWAIATIVMLLASVLLMGSLLGNPALPTGGAAAAVPERARGVFAITRHPMMWAFALWAACHALVYPDPSNLVLVAAVAVLALVGAALQDRKKAHPARLERLGSAHQLLALRRDRRRPRRSRRLPAPRPRRRRRDLARRHLGAHTPRRLGGGSVEVGLSKRATPKSGPSTASTACYRRPEAGCAQRRSLQARCLRRAGTTNHIG